MLTPRSLWGRSDFRALLPLKCPWRISSGTQRAESPIIQDIAAEVPLEDLQRHSKGSRPHNKRIRSSVGEAHWLREQRKVIKQKYEH